jgi:hypothetical protein
MPRPWRACLVVVLPWVLGCAAPEYTGRGSQLPAAEQHLLRTSKGTGGFQRLWRLAPGFPALGLVKWDSDRAAGNQSGRATFLDLIREELGRVNQAGRQGEEARVSVTLLGFERRGVRRRLTLRYEFVGRTRSGTLLWAAYDELEPSEEFRSSAADDEELLLARAITAKFRAAFRL